MKPEDLTIEMLEEAWEHPAEEWHGKCSQLAHTAIAVLGHGNYAYGHYHGDVDPDGFWENRAFQRHGWVLLDDGRVLDPTRWSFENVEPYIYIGENDSDYDEGGNAVRTAFRMPCPNVEDGDPADLEEIMSSRYFFEELTGTPFNKITRQQAAWVASESYDRLGFAVAPVYETLIANDLQVFIPIDNYNRAVREGRIKPEEDAGQDVHEA